MVSGGGNGTYQGRVVWCHLLHCSAVTLFGEGETSMPINATGGIGELVTSVPRPDPWHFCYQ
jgi:hypothetical protein